MYTKHTTKNTAPHTYIYMYVWGAVRTLAHLFTTPHGARAFVLACVCVCMFLGGAPKADAAITYYNSTSTPVDGGSANEPNTGTITPPTSMTTGDLVFLIAQSDADNMSITTTGGQTWTDLTLNATTTDTTTYGKVWWATYNGTWSANPAVNFAAAAGTNPSTVVMHVFRPTDASSTWSVESALTELDFAAAATITITGQTTATRNDTVTLAGWLTSDDNSWGSLSGTGWSIAGNAQYRNLGGNDQSMAFAYKIMTSPTTTGNVSLTQTLNGNDSGTTFIVTMRERRPITISGSLYSDAGVTLITSPKTISIAVGTTTNSVAATTSRADGSWSYVFDANNTIINGTPILAWVDATTSIRAAHFTKASSTLLNFPGIDLYQNRLIVSHEATTSTSTSITDMSFYDWDNDSDIQFTANNGALNVLSGQGLHIRDSKTFKPGGAVTLNANGASSGSADGSLYLPGTAIYDRNDCNIGTTTISGSLIASSSARVVQGCYDTSLLLFAATTSGKVIYTPTTTIGTVVFNGSGGGWTFGTTSYVGNMTISAGTVNSTNQTLYVGGNFIQNGTFSAGSGTTTFTGFGSRISGYATGTNAFNNVSATTSIQGNEFYTIASTTIVVLRDAAFDTSNNIAYAVGYDDTSNTYGQILRCDSSTDCDNGTDWVQVTKNVTEDYTATMLDQSKGLLYIVGSVGTNGLVKTCQISTGCSSSGNFITATSMGGAPVNEILIETTNNAAFTFGEGPIGRCVIVTSSSCTTNGDWAYVTTTPYSLLDATFDSRNGVLYTIGRKFLSAPANFEGVLMRCSTASLCDTGSDWTFASTTSDFFAPYGIEYASTTGILYASYREVYSGTVIRIYACDTITLCDAGTDWRLVNSIDQSSGIYTTSDLDYLIDTDNQWIYFSAESYLLRCYIPSNCDDSSEWIYATSSYAYNPIGYDSVNKVFYFVSTDGSTGALMRRSSQTSLASNASTSNFTIDSGKTLYATGTTVSISGNYTNNGTFLTPGTTTFNGTSAQIIAGNLVGSSTFNKLIFTGAGSKTFGNNASTSDFITIDSGATVVAPSSLTVGGSYTNNGTFTKGSGTVYFAGLGGYASGTLTGTTGGFNNIVVNSSTTASVAETFITATTTGANVQYARIAIDAANRVMYIGAGTAGLIRCVLSTQCDEAADFTISTTTAAGPMAIDTVNQVLYIGAYSSGIIMRCLLSTGCDDASDFTIPTSTSAAALRSAVIDTTNQVLYMGGGTAGQIYRCALSSGCDDTADFTLPVANATYVWRLVFDATNGALYAGTGAQGIVLKCSVSSACDQSGDFSTATDTPETSMYAMAIDQTNGVLYSGSGNNGKIVRCVLSSGCGTGNFTLAIDIDQSVIAGMAIDQTNGVLYFGTNQAGYVYKCLLSSGCDQTSDVIGPVFDSTEALIGELFVDASTTALYGVTDTTGQIIRRAGGVVFSANASTSNFTIASSSRATVLRTLSLTGNYVNAGTFNGAQGTTTFNGTTAQTATGTMTGSSAFYNLEVTNSAASTTFNAPLTVSNQFSAVTPGTRVVLASNATSTFANLTIVGSSGNEIWLRSTTDGSEHKFVVTGSYTVSYANIKDSNACGSTGGTLTALNSIEGTGNTCWTFSTPVAGGTPLILSGTLYSDEGVTPIQALVTIGVAVGTTTTSVHSTTSLASGAWSVNLGTTTTVGTSTPIVIWTDATSSIRAALVTKWGTATTATTSVGYDLYQNRVIISQQGTTGTSTTISDMSFYDADNDGDIQYSAATSSSGNALTVFTNQELHVKDSKTFAPGGSVAVNGNASSTSLTDGSLRLSGTATYTAGGYTKLAGSFRASSTATFNHNDYALVMNATTTGKVVNAPIASIGNVFFSGYNGTYTFSQNATTTNFGIDSFATVTAPTHLTVEGRFGNGGGFIHNSGTVYFASSSEHSITGQTATSSPFNNLVIDKTGVAKFAVPITEMSTSEAYVSSLAIDETNGVLYVGGSANGVIYRCVLSTGCDATGDIATAYIPAVTYMHALTIDQANGVLYAAFDGGVYRCVLSTSCDAAEDFTTAFSTSTTGITSLTIDTTNSILYAGDGILGQIYRCNIATSCDASTDFTVPFDLPGFIAMYALTVDETNGILYATGGNIYRCVTASGCDAEGDFTTAFTATSTVFYALAVDTQNSVLYAGSATSGLIYRCPTASGCDATSDFTVAYDATEGYIFSLAVDTQNGALYAGAGTSSGLIYRCPTASGCDAQSDFKIAYDTDEKYIKSLAVDTQNGALYAGSYPNGIVYKCALCYDPENNTTVLTNLTVESGASLVSNAEMRISGDYTNNGTTSISTSVLQQNASIPMTAPNVNTLFAFTGNSAQSITGTITGTSSLPNVLFSGNGTKTFSSNASTTGDVTINSGSTVVASSPLTIGGGFVNNGTFTAPNSFVLQGNYTNSGTFTQSSGTTTNAASFQNFIAGRDSSGSSNGTSATALYALAVSGNYLYVGKGGGTTACSQTAGSAGANHCELQVYDISSSTNPVYVAGRDASGSSNGTVSGIYYDLAISGDRLYGITAGGTTACSQTAGSAGAAACEFHVYDISSSTNPTFVASLDSSGSATGTSTIRPNDIKISGNYAFIARNGGITACSQVAGSAGANHCELQVIDISSTTRPFYAAGRDTSGSPTGNNNPNMNALTISGTTLYVAKPSNSACSDTAGQYCALNVFDITDPTNPRYVAGRDSVGTHDDSGTGDYQTLAVSGNSLYVGMSEYTSTYGSRCQPVAGYAGYCYLHVYDISSTTNPTFVTARDTTGTASSSSSYISLALMKTMYAHGNYLYVGTSNSGFLPCTQSAGSNINCALHVYDISSSSNPVYVLSRDTSGTLASTTGGDVLSMVSDGKNLFVGRSNSATTACSQTPGVSVACELMVYAPATYTGSMTAGNAFNTLGVKGTGWVKDSASTTNLVIQPNGTLITPQSLTISGNYANNGTFTHQGGTTTFSGSSAQSLSGNMTATSTFNNLAFTGAGTKTFSSNASSTNFVIESGSAVTAPSLLTIGGNFRNSGTFTAGATTTLSSTTAQNATGTMTGTNGFNTLVLSGTSTKSFGANASTTNLVIETNATAVLPPLFSISGNYQNSGTTTAGSGTTTFNGTSFQTATGTMTGTSAFYNLAITNTSGFGSSSQSIRFGGPASTTGTFTMVASTSAQFSANSSSTFQNIALQGAAGQYVWLRSSEPGTRYSMYVPGTQQVTYVDAQDVSSCPSTILATDGTNVDSGNTFCWIFALGSAVIVSADNQTFSYLQATTSISTITITDDADVPSITAANDLRLIIATSTVNMKWDTTDTTATFGGTASGKVSNPVSYAGNGAILIIPVDTDFAAGDTLTIDGLSYAQFASVTPATVALGVRTSGAGTSTTNVDNKTVTIAGTITLANADAGQIQNQFTSTNISSSSLISFKLTPAGETFTISDLALPLQGIRGIVTGDVTGATLYRDLNSNGTYDAGTDVAVGGEGTVSINEKTGSISFGSSFQATTTQSYVLVADVASIKPGDAIVLGLTDASFTTTGISSLVAVSELGSVSSIQHQRTGLGSQGSHAATGRDIVAGAGTQTGGGSGGGGGVDPNTGDTIGNAPGFNAPSAEGAPLAASWTNPTSAYSSDGVYATANSSVSHGYGNFSFSVPGNNTVTGIGVKIEASGSTAAGTISVRLTWDGGSSFTSYKTTGTLAETDGVFELGGQGDTWGRSWTASELSNSTFAIEILGNPSGNTISVDAIQVRVYHQATGGGGGGGGRAYLGQNQFFANVYSAVGEVWGRLWNMLVK